MDPPFGISGTYEGFRAEPELPQNLYRLDTSGLATVVASGLRGANGLFMAASQSIYSLCVHAQGAGG